MSPNSRSAFAKAALNASVVSVSYCCRAAFHRLLVLSKTLQRRLDVRMIVDRLGLDPDLCGRLLRERIGLFIVGELLGPARLRAGAAMWQELRPPFAS